MKKVNTFIVGAMKAGTTSFVEVLSKHNDIYVPPVKEPHYLIDDLPLNLYQPSRFFSLEDYLENEFPKPLHIANVKTEEQYHKVFSLANSSQHLCDCSTSYIHAPESPSLIKKYNPEAKIIVLTRDPIKRAFSHYKMDLGLGRTKRSFEEIMIEQIEAYYAGALSWNTYLAMSFYNTPVARYKALFKDVLVVDFKDFITDTELTSRRITNFLCITEFDDTTVTHNNETKKLRFQKVFYYLKKIGVKDYFSKYISTGVREKIFNLISTKQKKSPIVSNKVNDMLTVIFNKESGI